jgi:phage RecT family recombinase
MAVQLVKAHDRAEAIEGMFKINREAMVRQTPRTTGDPLRLLRIAFNAIVYDNDLMQCTPVSLLGGVMEALKLGITLGGPMQEGWLLPFRDSQQGGNKVATLIVGYQGYRNVIDRGRSVLDMHPYAVYKGDEFDFELGSHPRIKHKPYWMAGNEQGDLMAVYCVAHLRGGGMQLEVMPLKEVEQHKARSRAAQSGRSPWKTDYDAMALKTVVRKISKYLPKSSELLARALDLDDKADRGVMQDFDISGLTVPPALQEGQPQGPGEKPVGPGKLSQLTQTLQTQHPLGGQKEGAEGQLTAEELAALDRETLEQDRRQREGR